MQQREPWTPQDCGCGVLHGKDARLPPFGEGTPLRSSQNTQRSGSPRAPKEAHRVPARFVTRIESAGAAELFGELTCEAPTLGPRLVFTLQAGRRWAQRVAWSHSGYECHGYRDIECSELIADLETLGYEAPHVLQRTHDVSLIPPHALSKVLSLPDAARFLRSASGAPFAGFTCPVPLRKNAAVQCDFGGRFNTRPCPNHVGYRRVVPVDTVRERLTGLDSLANERKAAEERWRAMAWFYTLDDPGSGVESPHEACCWSLRTDEDRVGHWGRLCQALLAEDPELGFCSPAENRTQEDTVVYRALLVPWDDSSCRGRYEKGKRVLWAQWTLATRNRAFAEGFLTPRPGELVPVVMHLKLPPYDPAVCRSWDLKSVTASDPELEETLIAPWTCVVPEEDPRCVAGVWHVKLKVEGQLLTGGDLVLATVLVRTAGFEDKAGVEMRRNAWQAAMPQWHLRSSGSGLWHPVRGCLRSLALFENVEDAVEWMRDSSQRACGGLVFRVVAEEAVGTALLREYYFNTPELVSPCEMLLVLPEGEAVLREDVADLGALQVAASPEVVAHFLDRPTYSIATGEWTALRDAPQPSLNGIWYCWRRVGKSGIEYGDVETVHLWPSESVAPIESRNTEVINLERVVEETEDWCKLVTSPEVPMRPFE
eukprot:Hpha_TRINITY_DN18819_c0_g1::TRINITY_DN18819_c0_g1_i1::g.26287::m.26287